jgi:Glycosyl hydrolases family 18
MRSVRRGLWRVGWSVVVAVTLGMSFGVGVAYGRTPIAEVAPYFETTNLHTTNLHDAIATHGLRSFTAAFVLGNACTPTWDDHSTITGTDPRSVLVRNAKAQGATPIISFGGQAGSELASVCTNPAKLAAAYMAVITKFAVTKVDFDIEGAGPLNDTATNNRRYQAIKTLEKKQPKLEVSLTIPVGLSGINSAPMYGNAMAFLKAAKTDGARIDVVNLMTMNYGSAVGDMGAAATTATTDALAQIRTIWSSDTYHNIGITPMIGENDSAGEVFSWNDSQTVVAFAHAHGVRRLAFWALNRDESCGTGDAPPDTCSDVSQAPLDYTDGFLN